MNIKAVLVATAFLSMIAPPAFAQMTAPPVKQGMPNSMMRGEHGSKTNLRFVNRRLVRLIDQLRHDDHDFGGHRVRAIELLRQARVELEQAIQYDNTHPGM